MTETKTYQEWWGSYDVTDGIVKNDQPKSITEICEYCVEKLKDDFGLEIDEYFDASYDQRKRVWPLYGRIAIFAVTGGSEGHYVHVENLHNEKHRCLMLAKTFRGMDFALSLVSALTKILEV
jgi:hypothetical protein